MRFLLEGGYIGKEKLQETKAGFKTQVYALTIRANLALLMNSIDLGKLVNNLSNDEAQTFLAFIVNLYPKDRMMCFTWF